MAMTTSTSKKTKNIVVVGGGVQGTSVAYQLLQKAKRDSNNKDKLQITILES
eukprot:CAMPEP_0170789816 /NCGR_PEP_ID=MMETSP0733-20121128/19982_1 /TAXON_ID=186038 /ORGANISM="Fragilariopsis kerguelensis, Strain L26-C5" /LENGTH=51 /DNA_ID=CAMNT_0011137043 /DNA_START=101 /DNA_END=252 /DNA_ORIENTATION=-